MHIITDSMDCQIADVRFRVSRCHSPDVYFDVHMFAYFRLAHGCRLQVSVCICQASGVHTIPDPRVQMISYVHISGVRLQVSGVRCQVSGFRCQVSGFRLQISDFRGNYITIRNYMDIEKTLERKVPEGERR